MDKGIQNGEEIINDIMEVLRRHEVTLAQARELFNPLDNKVLQHIERLAGERKV